MEEENLMDCACCDKEKYSEDGEWMTRQSEESMGEQWVCVDCRDNGLAEKEGFE